MGERPAMAIVILNWNRPADTAECLRSLRCQTYLDWRAIVVDNGSTDDSVERLREEFPDVELLATGQNLGFAGGCNVGVRRALAAACDWVLLLNNDTVLAPDCLQALVAAAPADAGVLSPAIYYYAAPGRLWSAGARQRLGLPSGLAPCDLAGNVVPVDYITGCAMLVRRTVFDTVGLLAEHYFMYYEDSDFCVRARRAGFGIAVVPRARLWHKVGLSLRDDAPAERYLRMSSGVRFYRRELCGWRRVFLGVWVANRLLHSARRDALRGAWPCVAATISGLWDGLREAPERRY